MATDKNSDDLVSKRMADNDPEATAQFDAFPRESEPEKPAMFTDEEWALLSDGPSPKEPEQEVTPEKKPVDTSAIKRQQSSARPAAQDQPTQVMPAPAAQPDPSFYHRFGVLDFVATAIIVISMPFMLMALAFKIASSNLFLRFEYFMSPWFPADKYGFHSDDRLHYASYVVDYLFNGDSSRYLADVVFPDGRPVFTDDEIAHMADVKGLVTLLFFIAIVGLILSVVSAVYLSRKHGPGIHRALRWSGIVTLVLFAGLAVIALFGWDRFFTGFHQVFFASGTWQFYLDDSLIRLFPPQFWVDAGVFVAAFVVLLSILLISFSRIGHKQRKQARARAQGASVKKTK